MHRQKLLPAQVKLYRNADQAPGKYEEIALLHSSGDYAWTDEPKMFASMMKKAGELGANAPSGREAIIPFRPFSLSSFRDGSAWLRASSPAVQPVWPVTHRSFAGVGPGEVRLHERVKDQPVG